MIFWVKVFSFKTNLCSDINSESRCLALFETILISFIHNIVTIDPLIMNDKKKSFDKSSYPRDGVTLGVYGSIVCVLDDVEV